MTVAGEPGWRFSLIPLFVVRAINRRRTRKIQREALSAPATAYAHKLAHPERYRPEEIEEARQLSFQVRRRVPFWD